MDRKKKAFNAFRIDLMSPETEKITGYKPFWGPVTIAYLEEVWGLLELDQQSPGKAYVLFEVGLTFGVEVAEAWKGKSVDELEKLMRRKYKNNPLWNEHKYRFMNRVTRVLSRARKMQDELH